MLKDGEDTAAGLLANGRAFGLEVRGVGRDGGRVRAVQVGDPEDIGSAALSRAVEAGARDVELTLLNLDRRGQSDACEDGGNGGEVLHDGLV